MEKVKAIVEHAMNENLKDMRDVLFDDIMERVYEAIEQKKMEVAKNLLQSEEKKKSEKDEDENEDQNDDDADDDEDDDEDDEDGDNKKYKKNSKKASMKEEHSDEKEDKKLVKKMVKKDALKEAGMPRKNYGSNHHEYNMRAAEREMARRHAEGEDMSNHYVDPKTYEIKKKVQKEEIELKEGFKIGDEVMPAIGPHAGVKHKVIHVYGDGHYNIQPDLHVSKVKYRQGAVKAHDSQISKWKEPKKDVKEEIETIQEKNWIKKAIKHPGALHRELGVPAGKDIPDSKLDKAAHASGKEGKRARLALTLKKMH